MTGKERAAWRAKANSLEPLFQIGKGGISDALIKQTDDALRARELIKLKVLLESSPVSVRDAANELAEKLGRGYRKIGLAYHNTAIGQRRQGRQNLASARGKLRAAGYAECDIRAYLGRKRMKLGRG